jgi:hypothetical protein
MTQKIPPKKSPPRKPVADVAPAPSPSLFDLSGLPVPEPNPEVVDLLLRRVYATLKDIFTRIDAATPEALVGDRPELISLVAGRRKTREMLESALDGDGDAREALQALVRATIADGVTYGSFTNPDTPEAAYLLSDADTKRDIALEKLTLWLLDGKIADEAPAAPNMVAESAVARSSDYFVHTGQEMDAYLRAAADGRSGANWDSDVQGGTRVHKLPGLSHFVKMELTAQERALGLDIGALEQLTQASDADGIFAMLYVSRILAPPSPLSARATTVDWIDLDDVADKIGLQPGKLSAEMRAQVRRRVWDYIQFGARARVVGSRTGVYVDKATGERIQTRIDSPLWSVQGTERAINPPPGQEDVPRRVEIAISREWQRLISSPQTAQYLPMGEQLGAIPPGKAAGAWARVIGLSLANVWRRKPRETLDHSLPLTRRELLSRYAIAVAPFEEVLASTNPRRAIRYWADALTILIDQRFLEMRGEAAPHVAEKGLGPGGQVLGRQGWKDKWLDTAVFLYPGSAILAAVEACADALPAGKPRTLYPRSDSKTSRGGS